MTEQELDKLRYQAKHIGTRALYSEEKGHQMITETVKMDSRSLNEARVLEVEMARLNEVPFLKLLKMVKLMKEETLFTALLSTRNMKISR